MDEKRVKEEVIQIIISISDRRQVYGVFVLIVLKLSMIIIPRYGVDLYTII